MRFIQAVLLVMLSFSVAAQDNNPFLHLKFDKVVFYDFQNTGDKSFLIIASNGTPEQKIVKQVQLDSVTIKKLNVLLGSKKSYGAVTAACFDPHCGFVYFLKGAPVAQVSICLGCNGLSSTIDIPAQKQGKQGKGKDAYYTLDGLSKSFRQSINNMLRKYSFSHQIQPG